MSRIHTIASAFDLSYTYRDFLGGWLYELSQYGRQKPVAQFHIPGFFNTTHDLESTVGEAQSVADYFTEHGDRFASTVYGYSRGLLELCEGRFNVDEINSFNSFQDQTGVNEFLVLDDYTDLAAVLASYYSDQARALSEIPGTLSGKFKDLQQSVLVGEYPIDVSVCRPVINRLLRVETYLNETLQEAIDSFRL